MKTLSIKTPREARGSFLAYPCCGQFRFRFHPRPEGRGFQNSGIKLIAFLTLFLFLCLPQAAVYAWIQTPWMSNENGNLSRCESAYNYTAGYRFSPAKNGQIVRLGGFFDGNKVVKVWDVSTGQVIASAMVSGGYGAWRFTDIRPIDVAAGRVYIVAAYMGDGASKRSGVASFPQIYGDITIQAAMTGYGNTIPNSFIYDTISGQVDISFISYDDIHAIKPISRKVENMGGNWERVTLFINLPYGVYKAFGIVEYFPEGSKVLKVSHGGVIRQNTIAWIASEFSTLSLQDTVVTYEILNEGGGHIYSGAWVSMNPATREFIGGQFYE